MNPQFTQPKTVTAVEGNKQSIARDFGVKSSEVCYAKADQPLTGYKVIYDKATQRAYSLPTGLTGTVTSIASNGVLIHSDGTVDLGALAVSREEYVTVTGSFTSGQTLNVKNEALTDVTGRYIWTGSLPKTVPANSTPESTGGISDGAWFGIGVPGLTNRITDPDGATKYPELQLARWRDEGDVRGWGADPTGVNDSTSAFAAALGENGDQVTRHVPAGTFKVSDWIWMGIRKQLIGAGRDVTKIIFDNTDNTKTKVVVCDAYSVVKGIHFENAQPTISRSCIVSNSQATTNGLANGEVSECESTGFDYFVDGWAGLTLGLMFSNRFYKNFINGAKVGFRTGAGSNNNVYDTNTFIGGLRPFHFNNCTSMVVRNSAFEGNTDFDLVIESCTSMLLDTNYHEPCNGIQSTGSTGIILNAHLTNFKPSLINFLTAQSDSHWIIDGAFDEDAGGTSTASQFWYITDVGSTCTTRNCRVNSTGIQKGTRRGDDGYVMEAWNSGGWYIQKFANGILTMDYNSEAASVEIMTGTTATYEAAVAMPTPFTGLPSVSAGVWANASNSFLGVESPRIYARARIDGTVGVSAVRTYASYADGYFYSLKLTGKWK